MTAEKKKAKKPVMTLELSWGGVALLVVILMVTYGGMFVMGFFAGKGFEPGSVDTDALARRLVTYLTQSPAKKAEPDEKPKEERQPEKATLDFYDTLEKGKPAEMSKEAEEKPLKEPEKKVEGSYYMIQISSLKDPERAKEMAGELKESGFPTRVVEVVLEGMGTHFRVMMEGEFTLPEAESLAKKLEEKTGQPPLVMKVR